MREACAPTCPQLRNEGEGQGRGCRCSLRATRGVVALIALRVMRWCSETPEQPALIFIVAGWTWFTYANWQFPPF
jgi:hypothetical protein